MYYIAKSLEFLGLFIILIGFLINFPGLMKPEFFISGFILFMIGWIIDKYILE